MELFENQMDCIIVEAFPQFSLEEVQSWTLDKALYYYTRAEWILTAIRGVPLEVIDESEELPSSGEEIYN